MKRYSASTTFAKVQLYIYLKGDMALGDSTYLTTIATKRQQRAPPLATVSFALQFTTEMCAASRKIRGPR
jgi:hypothetical protein